MRVDNHKLLTRAEERALALRYKAGDKAAGNTLIACNQRFAAKEVWKWAWTGIPMEDLMQEANLGLLRALAKYDPERGPKFMSYAVHWIHAMVGLRVKRERKHSAVSESMGAEEGEDGEPMPCSLPDDGELADAQLETWGDRLKVREAVAKLSERERYIIQARHLTEWPVSLRVIGDRFGFSRERARQVERQALGRLSRLLALAREQEEAA